MQEDGRETAIASKMRYSGDNAQLLFADKYIFTVSSNTRTGISKGGQLHVFRQWPVHPVCRLLSLDIGARETFIGYTLATTVHDKHPSVESTIAYFILTSISWVASLNDPAEPDLQGQQDLFEGGLRAIHLVLGLVSFQSTRQSNCKQSAYRYCFFK